MPQASATTDPSPRPSKVSSTVSSTVPSKAAFTASTASRKSASRPHGRRLQVRLSGVHGKGVFALVPFKRGETVIEYTGEVITWKEALRRHPHDPSNPDHTFYFHVDDKHVIDGKHTGNSAKWINHGCAANCEAEEVDGRIFVRALRAIKPGEELAYDYGLVLDGRHTPKVKKQFECRCGSRRCRGTMLAPKR